MVSPLFATPALAEGQKEQQSEMLLGDFCELGRTM